MQAGQTEAGIGNFPALNHTDVPISRSFLRVRLERIIDCFRELLKDSGIDAGVRATQDGFIEFYVRSLDLVQLHSLKRFLKSTNTIDAYNLGHRSIKRDADAEEISFIIAHAETDLGELYKRTLPSLNPETLDRHQLVRLIDKERMAAFWDYREFIEKHGEEIITANARKLLKAIESGETIVVNEKNLIAAHGNEALKARGFIPDEFDYEYGGKTHKHENHYLGFKFSDHRYFAPDEKGKLQSFIVIQNDRIHPNFPVGMGSIPRKDEFHAPIIVIKEYICTAGVNQKTRPDQSIYSFIDGTPSSDPSAIVVKLMHEQAREIARQYQGKIESLMDGSVSNFHFDINTGRVITRNLIAGVESRLLAEKIPTEVLRQLYAEQLEEERFRANDPSGRKWKGLLRGEIGFPTGYIQLALRTQFAGLTSEKIRSLADKSDKSYLTAPAFKQLNSNNE